MRSPLNKTYWTVAKWGVAIFFIYITYTQLWARKDIPLDEDSYYKGEEAPVITQEKPVESTEKCSNDIMVLKNNYPWIGHTKKLNNNFQIFVHNPKDCIYISSEILSTGYYEPVLTDRWRAALGESSTVGQRRVVDIGANLGWFSLLSASMGHTVISVEPMDYNLEIFRSSISINHFESLITVHKRALSDQLGPPLCMKPAYKGNGPQNKGNGQLVPMKAGEEASCTEIISISTLNDLIDSNEHYFLVKLDIEGYEAMALRGGSKLFTGKKKPCFVYLEFYKEYVEASGAPPFELFERLLNLGYTAFDIYGNKFYDKSNFQQVPDSFFEFKNPQC